MRIRHKPWARPELEATSFYVIHPNELRGRWREHFGNDHPIELELGCGKGGFISQLSPEHPEKNFLAMDIKSEVLVLAKRKIEAEYERRSLPILNVALTAQNIELIDQVLSPEDAISRIYINFCNPWPKHRDKKKRLTHPRQLEKYKAFLLPGSEIRFKTDDDNLFEESIRYFTDCGFAITTLTRDLKNSGFTENIPTEHENMFEEQGIPIKFLIARFPEETIPSKEEGVM